jgi:flagellar hook-length control protein FliK
VKRIDDLLNSLLTKPEDKTGLLNGLSSGSTPKTSTGQTGSFSQVLGQVTQAQNASESNSSSSNQVVGSGSTPNANSGQVGSQTSPAPQTASNAFLETISQTSIAITETLRNASMDQVRQAEQTLQNLMAGLLNLLQGLSSANTSQPTAQDQGQSLNAAMGLSPADLKAISNMLQPFVQNLPEGQNPLLLNPDQQARLLAQMVQQMMSAQQVLFGTQNLPGQGSENTQGQVQGIGQVTGASGSVAVIQMNFSDLQVGLQQNQGSQASQVLINLENFKMSATFVQVGAQNTPSSSEQGLTPFIPSSLPAGLADQLQTALNGAQLNPASVSPSQQTQPTIPTNGQNPGLMKNFKELVQLLLQSGVTQAALTSFMKRAQENPNSVNSNAGTVLLQSGVTQTALSSFLNPVQGNAIQPSSAVFSSQQENGLKPGVPSAPNESLMPPVEASNNISSGATRGISVNLASQLNEVSSRLAGGQENPAPQKAVINNPANLPEAGSTNFNPPISQVPGSVRTFLTPDKGQNTNGPVGPVEANPVTIAPSVTKGVQTPQELQNIVIQNDNTSKLNAVSLHATQGSLTFGDIHPLSNQVYTLDQVTGSKAATQLNSPIPAVVSGSPSVPQNAQTVTPVETMIKGHVIQNEVVAALNEVNALSQVAVVPPSQNTNGAAPQGSSQTPQIPAQVHADTQNSQTVGLSPITNQNQAPEQGSGQVQTPSGLTPVSGQKADVFTTRTQNQITQPNGPLQTSRPETVPHTVVTPAVAPGLGPEVQYQAAQALGTVPPAPTSSTPLVPSTVVVGEGIKNELQPQTTHGISNPNQTTLPGSFQADQTIKTHGPEGLTPVVSMTNANTQSQVSTVTDKGAPKDTASLNLASLLTTSGSSSTQPGDSGKFAEGINNLSNTPRFSMDSNQLFNLVATQITSQMTQARNVSRLSFQLMPESLGKVTVQIALVDQSLSARIVVSNPEVRDAVQTHLVDLRASLAQAGLQIDQLQVQVQGGGANLLAQYYQYQQEGSSYRNPVFEGISAGSNAESPENTGVLAPLPGSLTLVDLLA